MKRSAYETKELEAARTSAVAKYFNPVVGQHDEIKTTKRDKFDNAKGAEFDLGKDGAFTDFKVLIGNFLSLPLANTEAALKKKGFQVEITIGEAEFIKGLDTADVAMFISVPTLTQTNFLRVVFHPQGLWCWTDNDPFFEHANAVLEHFQLLMTGNTPGSNTLTLSDDTHDPPRAQFKRHVITTGIKTLYEGITISYLDALPKHKQVSEEYPLSPFKVLAQSSDGHPVSAFLDNEFTEKSGRMLVDGGFTKLYVSWDDAGTARYVVNGTIWLLGLERAAAQKGMNKKGGGGHWVWEWKNGDEWSAYHIADASLLEKKNEQGAKAFSTKELSFNKAHGTTYKFDLGKMTQTNTSTGTAVKMRRRAAKIKERHLAVGKAEGEEDEKVLEEEDEEEEETPKKKLKKTSKKEESEEEEEEAPKKKTKKTPKKEEDEEEEEAPKKKAKKTPKKEEEEEEEAPKKKKAKKEEDGKKKKAKKKWVWEWQQAKNKWLPYAQKDASLLEDKLNDAQLSFKSSALSFNKGQTYQFDLEKDTQTNLSTGTQTKLRRRPATEEEDEDE